MLLKQPMGARARLFVSSLLGMLVCVWLVGATGCGSVLYVNQVTRKASASVAAAKAAEADVYAPYHYTLAVHYLHKAREEAAAADFQAANRFGRLSYQAGEKARELAVQRAAEPTDTSWKPPPGTPGHDGSAPAAETPPDENAEAPESETDTNTDGATDGAAEPADDAAAPAATEGAAPDGEAAAPAAGDAARPEAPAAAPARPKARPKAKPASRPDAAKPTEDGR
jgi:hypothetical protein